MIFKVRTCVPPYGTCANFMLNGENMEIRPIKTTIIKSTPTVEVRLEEMQDGQKLIHKTYPNNASIVAEWEALVYLYNAGFNVPKPIAQTEKGIYVQYIEGSALWDVYENANVIKKNVMIKSFTELLHSLHILKIADTKVCQSEVFLGNELTEIRNLIAKNNLNEDYIKVVDRLESMSINIQEQPMCYIHRDYHPWNVLSDKSGKLYIIDLELKQGDFRFDIAWTYMLMSRTGFPEFAECFLAEYKNLQPNALVEFEFFKQLSNLRWLVNVQPQTDGFMLHMIKIAELIALEFIAV